LERDAVQIAARQQRLSQTSRRFILAISCLLGLSVFLVSEPYWPDDGAVHESLETFGIALIVACVLGRIWCWLYLGNPKNRKLVEDGPYSVVRHPLSLFAIIGAIGIGAQASSFTAALAAGFLTWAFFLWMSQVEEDTMIELFGARYFEYMVRVPRFMPNFSLYHSRRSLEVFPRQIAIMFFDATVFFVAVPVMEAFDYLHDAGILPTLFRLP
jgi:protein-S-isoprenylcysteine O-methyltransferase Ste14